MQQRAGATRTKTFGRIDRQKVGSLPPNLVFFSVSLFSSSCLLFPLFPGTYAHPKLKKMLKTKLKCVIPTFFSCFAQILAARTERSFLLGWSDPRLTLGTELGKKVVSPHPNTGFARVQIDRRATRNLYAPNNFRSPEGERNGERDGDLSLSPTVHLLAEDPTDTDDLSPGTCQRKRFAPATAVRTPPAASAH